MDNIHLIEDLLKRASELPHRDDHALDAILKRSEMILRNVFGDASKYLKDLGRISFYPGVYPAEEEYYNERWQDGKNELLNLINTALEELQLFGKTKSVAQTVPAKASPYNKNGIFVVHGHDDGMKLAVARTIEKLGLDPIILHEKPNAGRTIIEKFTDYSGVSFAVVLLSPDDVARSRDGSAKDERFRARQNVIFELGFFIGRLGRDRVLVLYQDEKNFEMPSDYSGVLYTLYDSSGRWQFDLIKELKACGYQVDANKLL